MPDIKFAQRSAAPAAPLAGFGLTIPSDLGFFAWSCPPEQVVTAVAAPVVAGTLSLRKISLPGVVQVSNVTYVISVAGAALTAAQCFLGVWDGGGNLIALSADLSGVWTGTGQIVTPVTPVAPSLGNAIDTPYCYVGRWFNGTTSPFIAKGGTVDTSLANGAPGLPAAVCRCVSANAGLTTAATVPGQLGALSKINNTHGNEWYALS